MSRNSYVNKNEKSIKKVFTLQNDGVYWQAPVFELDDYKSEHKIQKNSKSQNCPNLHIFKMSRNSYVNKNEKNSKKSIYITKW